MRSQLITAALILLTSTSALAHEGAPKKTVATQRASSIGHLVEDSVSVEATLAELQPRLLDLECWPHVFSDARSLVRKEGDVWAVDFKQFGHPHDFAIRRDPRAVIFELAEQQHGAAKLEYRLQPIDARHTRLTIRLEMPSPPQMTQEQTTQLMRSKVEADLRDFARAALHGEAP